MTTTMNETEAMPAPMPQAEAPPQTDTPELLDGPLRPQLNRLTKVSVVIPVYNEEATIQLLVGLVTKAPLPDGLRREIIIVNDCSKDGTAKKLDELPRLYP